jgi:hypothetical protein
MGFYYILNHLKTKLLPPMQRNGFSSYHNRFTHLLTEIECFSFLLVLIYLTVKWFTERYNLNVEFLAFVEEERSRRISNNEAIQSPDILLTFYSSMHAYVCKLQKQKIKKKRIFECKN